MNSRQFGRRGFLKEGAALAGMAFGGIGLARGQTPGSKAGEAHPEDLHAYGKRSRFENSVRVGNNGVSPAFRNPALRLNGGPHTPLQDSVGIITPTSLHYIVSHGYDPPDIDPRQHRLLIHGMVDRPLILTMEDLRRLPSVSRVHFLECRANNNPSVAQRKVATATVQITHGLTSCSEWTGVPLSMLLKEAGVKKGASWLIAQGAEPGNHTKSIPVVKALDDVLVAYGQNGEAVRPDQGYPLRLVVPGYEGINNVKWLTRIKLQDQPTMDKREIVDYPELRPDGKARWFNSEIGPNSVITRPSGGERLPGRGFYEISGLAWSGGGAIRRVEVSTDRGRTWKDAQLQEPLHRKAHARFGFAWNWDGSEAVLQSRSTDERGQVQPTIAELATLWSLPSDYFQTTGYIFGHFNVIQPWNVTRDGSVENALFS